MRITSSVLVFCVVLATHGSADAQTKVIRTAKLWDGTRVLTDVLVVLDGDRIARMANSSESLPPTAEVIDLRKYTVLPGLIDLHTHMTYYWDRQPGTRPLGQRRRPGGDGFLAQDNARRTLETGVTTVRDLGAANDTDFAMRDLIAMGAMPGPRMFVAARASPRRRGRTPNPDAMAKSRRGTDQEWIRLDQGLRITGSFDSVETTQTLTFDEMKAIVDTAHAAGTRSRFTRTARRA